ncbi:hypothetical protein EG329_013711 [Mollisiaceae sp. DMI_Dod_QoI]|nr:hypothetical protein EG329_013711 [Helotiales sp. DMI_Dod_QoI]
MRINPLTAIVSFLNFTSAFSIPHPRSNNHESQVQTIHQFPNPTWVENLAVRSNGQILVDLVTTPEIYLLDPHPNSTATLVHNFTSDLALLGITETTPDTFHLIAGNFSLPTLSISPGSYSIYTVDLTSYNPHTNTGALIHHVALLSQSGILNGLSTLSATRGLIVAADSDKGVIWLIDVNTGSYNILLSGPELEKPGTGFELGINGIRVLPSLPRVNNNNKDKDEEEDVKWIYFDNQAKGTFHRVPISLSQRTNTSQIETLATDIAADDFALDPEMGVAYLACGTRNQVFRVSLNGGVPESVLGGLNSTEVANPTSVALARGGVGMGRGVGRRIFVTTAGGLEAKINGSFVEGGKVLSYDLDG